jgi:transcriptional regulator
MLESLTEVMEKGRENPWKPSDAPADYRAAMRRGIVGLELEVARLEGKWKMSQDKRPADRAGAAKGLRAEGAEAVADLIETLAPDREAR